MGLDTGSSGSTISSEPLGGQLNPPDYILRDFQQNLLLMLGAGKFWVKYWQFNGLLDLLVVEGHRTSLLGLTWFVPFGIRVMRVHQSEQWDFSSIRN